MLKTFLPAAFALLFCNALSAQTVERDVLANAGGTAIISGYTVCWTLGEAFVATRYAPDCMVILTEGFQQGEAADNFVCPTVAVEGPTGGSRIHLFPNPTQGTLTIDLGQLPTAPLHAMLTDAAGRTLRTIMLSEATTTLDLQGLPTAVYVLSLNDKKGWVRAVQVVKQ